MVFKNKLAVGAVGVLAVIGVGGGAAFASARTSAAHTVVHAQVKTPSAVDAPGGPDLQQGDQNGPDLASATAETPETPGAPETATAGDGPGGHADGPGDVQGQQGSQK